MCPSPTREHDAPLVTFALFAYNQEKYIREAVTGALVQDYPNLEIIISDDCSADLTFEVINNIVEAYEGAHHVSTRQTEANRGTLLHVDEVARIARGKLLVLAAGDDVSKQDRVSVLHQAWRTTGAWGLCSRFDRISAEGELMAANVRSPVIDKHGFERFFFDEEGPVRVVHGCTSAYDARVFQHLRLSPSDYVLSEDGAISVLLNLLGKDIVHLDESLILYRESPESLTNNSGRRPLSFDEIDRDERNIERFSRAQANRCRLFLRMNVQPGLNVRRLRIEGVETELALQEATSQWFQMPLRKRATTLIHRRLDRKWAMPRLLGRKAFYLVKWLATRLW